MTLLNTLNPFWSQDTMQLIQGIKAVIGSNPLVSLAKEIAAVLSLLYLSIRAYAMIAGKGELDITSLFRPFVITMVIVNFNLFSNIVQYPGQQADNILSNQFTSNAAYMDQLLDQKTALTDSVWQYLLQNTQALNVAFGGGKDYSLNIAQDVTNAMANLDATITVMEQLLWAKISLWLQGFVMWIVMGIFKGLCYCIFFVQLILIQILLTVGPLSFAFSIAGNFGTAWSSWTARMVSVSFYSSIGFVVLNIATSIVVYGVQQEIDRLQQLMATTRLPDALGTSTAVSTFIAAVSHVDNFIGYLLTAIIVTAAGMFSIPKASTWIVETSGAGDAVFGTVVRTAKTVVSSGAKAAAAAV